MFRISPVLLLLLTAACTGPAAPRPDAPGPLPSATDDEKVGVLVMAHGGDEAWNRSVDESMAALPPEVPAVVAYGMANPYSLHTGLQELEAMGVRRVVVVRAFLSGRSFLDQTRWYLGMNPEPPESFVLMGPAAGDSAAREALDHDLEVATHSEGILDSPEAARILSARADDLSRDPSREAVLLLAHGMGDEEENDEVLGAMERVAREIRTSGFADVRAATLREDWEEERREAEAEIRAYVSRQSEAGRRVLVLPVRLSGFGPYAEVLEGLEYQAGAGLLPHPVVGDWVMATANRVSCGAGWGPLSERCPRTLAPEQSPTR
ncbi:MAG: hypothetical protein P8188_05890 [Gemmatimonadota bacterium]